MKLCVLEDGSDQAQSDGMLSLGMQAHYNSMSSCNSIARGYVFDSGLPLLLLLLLTLTTVSCLGCGAEGV
jgi:hypothetical protein